jgi:hypothetical protein
MTAKQQLVFYLAAIATGASLFLSVIYVIGPLIDGTWFAP